ncbi:MAG: hypothetical protein AAF270_12685 [Pseudomonadota bacterium]
MNSLPQFVKVLSIVVIFGAAAACTSVSPPIQEMTDARLAIAAAEEAGAAKHAADQLAEATLVLRSAEANLERHAYAAARRDAAIVKEMAIEARRVAEAAESAPNRDTRQPLK